MLILRQARCRSSTSSNPPEARAAGESARQIAMAPSPLFLGRAKITAAGALAPARMRLPVAPNPVGHDPTASRTISRWHPGDADRSPT
jgi:hypothetical protein